MNHGSHNSTFRWNKSLKCWSLDVKCQNNNNENKKYIYTPINCSNLVTFKMKIKGGETSCLHLALHRHRTLLFVLLCWCASNLHDTHLSPGFLGLTLCMSTIFASGECLNTKPTAKNWKSKRKCMVAKRT